MPYCYISTFFPFSARGPKQARAHPVCRSIKEEEEEQEGVAFGGSRKPLLLAKTGEKLLRVPGCGLIFGDAISTMPPVFVHMVSNLAAVYETVVLITVR